MGKKEKGKKVRKKEKSQHWQDWVEKSSKSIPENITINLLCGLIYSSTLRFLMIAAAKVNRSCVYNHTCS